MASGPGRRPRCAADPGRRVRTLDDGSELRAADTSHHPRRAHRARPDSHLDDVGPGVDQLTCPVGGHDVAGDDRRARNGRTHLLDDLEDGFLVAVGSVDDEDVDTHRGERRGAANRIGVDADRDRDEESLVGVTAAAVDSSSATRPFDVSTPSRRPSASMTGAIDRRAWVSISNAFTGSMSASSRPSPDRCSSRSAIG